MPIDTTGSGKLLCFLVKLSSPSVSLPAQALPFFPSSLNELASVTWTVLVTGGVQMNVFLYPSTY